MQNSTAATAPTYVERNIETLRQRELQKKHHYDKLAQLQEVGDVKSTTKQQAQQYEKLKEMRQKVQKFDQQEKNTQINKNNQILLNKLVEISSGKWSSVSMAPKRVRQMLKQNRSMAKNISISNFGGQAATSSFAFTQKSSSVGPRSLNISVRKQENERIERENQAFAKRLFDNGGAISKKKMDQDYYKSTQYRNNLMKVGKKSVPLNIGSSRRKLPMGQDGRLTQLPPLNPGSLSASRDMTNRNSSTQNNFASKDEVGNLSPDEDLHQRMDSNSPKKSNGGAAAATFDQRKVAERQSFERPKAASEQPHKSPTRPKLANKQQSIKSNNSKANALRQSKDSALTGASVAKETIKEEEAKENQPEEPVEPAVAEAVVKQDSVVSKKSLKSQKTESSKPPPAPVVEAEPSEKPKEESVVEPSPQVEASKKATEPIGSVKQTEGSVVKQDSVADKVDDEDDNYSDDVDQQQAAEAPADPEPAAAETTSKPEDNIVEEEQAVKQETEPAAASEHKNLVEKSKSSIIEEDVVEDKKADE